MPDRSLRLVIFDLDGTLVDTLPRTIPCFQEVIETALGTRPSVEEVLGRFGPADHQIISRWVGSERASDAVDHLYRCYRKAYTAVKMFPGIPEILEELEEKKVNLAICTGRGRPSTDELLDGLGLKDRFQAVVTGEEAPRPKPHPDGVLMILDRLGVLPEQAVYVGDTRMDLEAASRARVRPIAALWGSPEPEALGKSGHAAAATVEALGVLLRDPETSQNSG